MITFIKNMIREYFNQCAERSADEAAFCLDYYPESSFGYSVGELHLAFAELFRNIAEAI